MYELTILNWINLIIIFPRLPYVNLYFFILKIRSINCFGQFIVLPTLRQRLQSEHSVQSICYATLQGNMCWHWWWLSSHTMQLTLYLENFLSTGVSLYQLRSNYTRTNQVNKIKQQKPKVGVAQLRLSAAFSDSTPFSKRAILIKYILTQRY